MKNSKQSSSSSPVTAPIVTVVGSDIDVVTNSNYLAYLQPNVAAARFGGKQANDGLDDPEEPKDPDDPDDPEDPPELNERPRLSDIEIVSNTLVFDSTGLPSVKVVFKVKNSSAKVLKAIDVRVERK